ncbi:ATP-dependent DNA helicase DDM1-like [Lolium rigidum]|uniref:ATP-dependent DNA helicase DDM1-like n=1 Tax=Lolium rigidum TaxID=89674 RepID=UPI001F5C5085|nr:ATP-dependent DNA helicase DDM1-like [Lolium rigidum]
MAGATVKPYLIKGVKWLKFLWQNGLNGILEDPVEFGAVFQTLLFLAHLKESGSHGPYMIVTAEPSSHISYWLKGIRLFPTMKKLIYFGDKNSRANWRRELVYKIVGPDFPIILTTYRTAMLDKGWLADYKWKYVVLDESDQMKKWEYEILEKLKHRPVDNKLLLVRSHSTKSLADLRSLLKFALPPVLSCLEEFDSWFKFSGKEGEEQQTEEERRTYLSKLHAILRPFLLRQMEDVENKVPQKKSATCYKAKVVQHPNAIGVKCSKNHATKEVTRTGVESCQEVAAEYVSETNRKGSADMRSSQFYLEGNEVVKRQRTNDALITPLGESNSAVHAHVQVTKSTSSELIFKALQDIPDLARADILRAYSTLTRDDRQFESLMVLPMDMRKDWLLMEIGNK